MLAEASTIQAVDLDYPCIALQLDELTPVMKDVREQVARRGGFDDHTSLRLRPEHGVDDLDGARRVPETVPRDVKDDAI